MSTESDLLAKGHAIITNAMAKARAAEQFANKNQAVTQHVEACLRELFSLLVNGPKETPADKTDTLEEVVTNAADAVEAVVVPEAAPLTEAQTEELIHVAAAAAPHL